MDSNSSSPLKDKLDELQAKYERLLRATAKLLARTSRRHASNKDLARTVLYLRSLYNQSQAPSPGPSQALELEERGGRRQSEEGEEYEEEVRRLQEKRCYSVGAAKAAKGRRRAKKELAKGKEKLELWGKWARQRAQIGMMASAPNASFWKINYKE